MIKVGVCAWVLPMEEREVFQFASEVGLDGVEIDLGNSEGKYLLQNPEVQQEYLDLAGKYQVQIPTLAMNTLCNISMTRAEDRALVYHAFESAIEIASRMKIATVQVPSFFRSFIRNDDDLHQTIECLKYASRLCEQNHLRIGTENDVSIEDNMTILKEVNSKNLFVYFDTQNPYRFANRDSEAIASALPKNILEIHAKDSLPESSVGVLLGEGDTNFDKVTQVFSKHFFNGWIHLESDYKSFTSFSSCSNFREMVKTDILKLRKLFSN